MKEILLLKLGELVLKGLNRGNFEKRLMKNINWRLRKFGDFKIYCLQSTIYVEQQSDDCDMDSAVDAIKKIFGIVNICRAAECEKDMEKIVEVAKEYLCDELSSARTFKVEAKRSDKSFPMKSPELCRELGGFILKNYPHLKVDVHNPELTVTAEVRDFAAYVHGGRIKGAGGMPVGSNGKATLLLSGGIDSPVSGYMVAKRGVSLEAVHFFSPPYTSERAKEKVIELAKLLTQYTGPMKLYIVPFTEPQLEIYEKCPEDLLTIIMRRIM
ncbi:MAG: tRNA 4-thiouridine(8) synthase ThiI, partial [Oscillospiraceae bacterium]|nr:tRNA 4-thiouridine(8) synthase ThiI [Oscillospiraceae bacterium]